MSTTTVPPLTPAGERILTAASDLFYRYGITAVGVDRIAEHAGTTKKTLYDRFGSKEGLTLAYLRRRRDAWQDFLAGRLAEGPGEGVERVLAVYDALEAWMRTHDRGCGFVNAYAELAGTGHSGLEVILEEKTTIRELYGSLVAELGVRDPRRLGDRLALLHEGASVTATAGGRPDAIRLARETARDLLGHSTGASTSAIIEA